VRRTWCPNAARSQDTGGQGATLPLPIDVVVRPKSRRRPTHAAARRGCAVRRDDPGRGPGDLPGTTDLDHGRARSSGTGRSGIRTGCVAQGTHGWHGGASATVRGAYSSPVEVTRWRRSPNTGSAIGELHLDRRALPRVLEERLPAVAVLEERSRNPLRICTAKHGFVDRRRRR